MKPGDLCQKEGLVPQFRDELHGQIGIIIRHIVGYSYAVFVGGQCVHFHKHVLEPCQ